MNRIVLLLAAITVSMPTWAADMEKAKENYKRYCSACHGFNGMSMSPDVPNLRLNQGLLQPDLEIIQKLKKGSQRKPPMSGLLTDQELIDIVTYSRTIR